MTEKYIKCRFRPNKHSGWALACYVPLVTLMEPYQNMRHCQSLPLHVSRSPQYRSASSRIPSQSLYKLRAAPFPKRSFTYLTQLSEFPAKSPHFSSNRERRSVSRALFHVSKSPVNETTSTYPNGDPTERDARFQSLLVHISRSPPKIKVSW